MRGMSFGRVLAALSLAVVAVTGSVSQAASPAHTAPTDQPVPDAACDHGSMPERVQGAAPAADYTDGRASKGYFCNAREISHYGSTGGYRVERYVDKSGHECAYWDSTLLFPTNVADQAAEGPGVYVMDMSDPRKPVHTDTLRTPAMLSPHESLRLNQKRGLLVADMGYPTWNPGFLDVYDVSQDCRHPVLDSSSPVGILGHEGGFSPDGKTFYVTSLYGHSIAAVDLSNPKLPNLLWESFDYQPHGVSLSDDGKTLFMADTPFSTGFNGLTILDVSQIQERKANPQVPIISRLTWKEVSTPQNATPFTEGGHPYLLETDEFGGGSSPVGAARIIDIKDLRHPFVVANLRLEVNNHPATTSDPGDSQPFQGYQGHYCSLPSRVDPYIVACSFIMSGLRVFDIRNITHPREVAYFNKPLLPGENTDPEKAGAFAMSAPAYDEATHDIWYTDGNSGFYVIRLTHASGVTTFAHTIMLPGN